METKLLKPNKESIELACKLLQDGEVVGVPTETVYGLAGDSRNGEAIKKIFKAKGRPADNPLIVHISNLDMLKGVVRYVSDDAKRLMDAFWPGPLTIIMPKGNEICNETCAGLDSVGVRMPSNPIAHEIIEKSKVPFSAPSANISGKPCSTNSFNECVPLYGMCASIKGPFNNSHSFAKAFLAAKSICGFLKVNCAFKNSLYDSLSFSNVFIGSSAIYFSFFREVC